MQKLKDNFLLLLVSFFAGTISPTLAMQGSPNSLMKKLKENEQEAYEADGCGICRKPGADVFWFSSHSRCAHKSCFTFIQTATSEFSECLDKIAALYPKDRSLRSHLEIAGNDAVLENINLGRTNRLTIKEFTNQNSVHALKEVYHSVGLNAVGGYIENYHNNYLRKLWVEDFVKNIIKEHNLKSKV